MTLHAKDLSPDAFLGRRWPIGAEPLARGGVWFRVWAPGRHRVSVVLDGGTDVPLHPEAGGYFSAPVAEARVGSLYRFRLDDAGHLYPDPASRFQPDGPHGPSQVVDPAEFRWSDAAWRGVTLPGQVLYEMHVGTFTPEGNWTTAADRLPLLREIGVTVVEVMPVAEFPGRFGWGYDGVGLFAPTRLYGTPDDFRRFVDRAHGLGLAVILDVVYNHLGPDGNHLRCFSPDYFTDRYESEWGDPINFDGPGAEPVREFFTANAAYWIDEFHLDGLRLDATQSVFDASPEHVLKAVVRAARAAAGGRSIVVVAENEPQDTRLVRPPDEGGYGMDGLWNDDFHHSSVVALTGRVEAYYRDHRGAPQEFVSAAKYGYLFQGQFYGWQGKRRGRPGLDLPSFHFVNYLQNHDQVANSAHGLRGHQLTSPGRWRAMTALLLLMPGTPMLFQGQEFSASAPFLYFADHVPDLAEKVREGRASFLEQFPSIANPEMRRALNDPHDPGTFERCRLDWAEWESNAHVVALHRDLLRLRREDPTLSRRGEDGFDGAVIGPEAFALRWIAADGADRLLVVNLGRDIDFALAEPLLAPPEGAVWAIAWSSEDPVYGGSGVPAPMRDGRWCVTGHAATLLVPVMETGAAASAG